MKSVRSNPIFNIFTLFALLASLLGGALTFTPAYAASIIVTTTTDEMDGNTCSNIDYSGGTGISLTEAICFANNNGAGSNTINLNAGTYTLSTWGGKVSVTSTIVINGAGAASTIVQGAVSSNTATHRVFKVSSGGNLTLNSMTVRNGRCNGSCLVNQEGGGVLNEGALTVMNSVFSGNSAHNGGGIHNSGSLNVSNSAFYSNHVIDYGGGGGIFHNSGTANVTNSTFYANVALGDGFGGGGHGGGIFNNSVLNLTNVTLSANSVTGSGLGGGIFNFGTLNFTNTIIANSTGADCHTTYGTLGTNTRNLVEDNTCSPAVNGDPNLGPLADNPGFTKTMELLKTPSISPAIDAGTNSGCPATDQRGLSRPQNGTCDIGAYEATDTFSPDTQIDSVPSSYTGGYITSGSSAAFSFSSPDDGSATFLCEMDGGGYSACTSPKNYTSLSEGSHTFSVAAKDSLENADNTPATHDFKVDTTAPTTTINGQPSDPNNDSTPEFTFSGSDGSGSGVASFKCKMDGGVYAVCASPFTSSTLADGSHTFFVKAIDNVTLEDATPASYAWTVDAAAPTVVSITLVYPSPTAKASVQFTVTFSEPVSGVDGGDFLLTAPAAIVGESITAVTPVSTSVYTVTVNTGSGNGTLRLDIVGSPSIEDLGMNPLAGSYTGGAAYTINKTLIYRSLGAQDGWILESTETSNAGGTLNASATTFNLGDNAQDKQYRSILSFNTATLPDNAVITRVTLKIRKQGLMGTNPFTLLGGLKVDMRKPYFGTAAGLAASDFQAVAGKTAVATFNATPVSNWYSALLNATGRSYVNKTGATQFRLRFSKDDNDDLGADYMKFFSGNYATASARPTLIIEYYVP